MSKNREIAKSIVQKAEEYGFELSVCDDIISVTKRFEPHNEEQMRDCSSQGNAIMSMLPTSRPGSTWGSDGIGWIAALESGHYQRYKSGGNKLVLKALARMLVRQEAC
jgi:hypothetical protein